ncbi:MAG: autotransporter-associated beta strand repeat-containing protein, partial [Patescibacteria group bacterium]|nr:autotransporter-associated beta strand repeat-containing protein [Patescibacteria group bacterium]
MACTLVSRGGCLSVVLAAWLAVEALDAPAAVTMSASATAPTVGADDIAQLVGGADIGGDQGHIWSNRPTQGQSFLTGASAGGYLLTAVTFQNRDNTATSGTFTVRIGTISGTTITTVRLETAGNAASYVPLHYITATLSTPIWLMPNQLYGVDWGSSGAGFVTCNNLDTAGNLYANGAAYSTGTNSVPGSAVTVHAADRVFHLAMDASSFTTWTGGGTTGDWSDSANWAGGVAPSSDSATSIVISGNVNVGTQAVPLQQNLAAPMVLNRLYVAGTGSGDSEVVLGGGALRFEANGTTAPQLIVERSQAVTLRNDLVAAANLTMNVFNGAATNDLVVEGQITGDGAITKQGPGVLLLTANNTYTGATTITAGTLQVGDGGTTGTLGTGDVTNNAALVFHRSDNLSVANAIAGSGSVTKLGEGTLTLTATNTYTGATTITAGTVQVGNGGTTGTLGTGDVTNNAALVFNRSNDLTVANVIAGTGSVTKQGTGTL